MMLTKKLQKYQHNSLENLAIHQYHTSEKVLPSDQGKKIE